MYIDSGGKSMKEKIYYSEAYLNLEVEPYHLYEEYGELAKLVLPKPPTDEKQKWILVRNRKDYKKHVFRINEYCSDKVLDKDGVERDMYYFIGKEVKDLSRDEANFVWDHAYVFNQEGLSYTEITYKNFIGSNSKNNSPHFDKIKYDEERNLLEISEIDLDW